MTKERLTNIIYSIQGDVVLYDYQNFGTFSTTHNAFETAKNTFSEYIATKDDLKELLSSGPNTAITKEKPDKFWTGLILNRSVIDNPEKDQKLEIWYNKISNKLYTPKKSLTNN